MERWGPVVDSELSQTTKTEPFTKIVTGLKSSTVLAKGSIYSVRGGLNTSLEAIHVARIFIRDCYLQLTNFLSLSECI